MLPFLIAPVLVGLSMLAQRPLSRLLGVPGPLWPVLPFAPSVRWSHRLAIRGAGLLFTFLLVLGGISLQTQREQRLLPRVKVAAGTAADEAGLQTNDLITAVDGVAVEDFDAFRTELMEGAGAKRLTLVRDGVTLERTATLRNGVLGVQASGEERAVTKGEAVQKAARLVLTLPVFYARALVRAATTEAVEASGPALPSKGPPRWLLAISFSLAFSWWLQLGVELGALGVAALRSRGQVR